MLSAKRDDPAYGSVVDTAALGTHVSETSETFVMFVYVPSIAFCYRCVKESKPILSFPCRIDAIRRSQVLCAAL